MQRRRCPNPTRAPSGRIWAIALVVLLLVSSTPSYATPPSELAAPKSLEDLLIPRKPIPYSLLALNAFVNEPRFGTIRNQLREVNSTLGIKKVRVLFAWNDQVQPSPSAAPNFRFYDQIVNALPVGTEALVIVTGAPSWMKDPKNWIDGNPRTTFVELWVKKVATRYARRGRVGAFQIWNEPNNPDFSENVTLDVLTKPENYVELIAQAYQAIKRLAPRKRVVSGATTAIAQNFPATLEYNKAMIQAGILSFIDIYALHYYGKSVERVIVPDGVADFVNSLSKPIWITETGAKGVTKQLEYAERLFSFLKAQMPGIARIYIYQFTDSSPAGITYGLRNLTPGSLVSDLYINLRERKKSLSSSSQSR